MRSYELFELFRIIPCPDLVLKGSVLKEPRRGVTSQPMGKDIKIEKVEQGGGSGEGKKIGEIKIKISLEKGRQKSNKAKKQPTLPEATAAGGKKTEGRDKRPSWADKADRHFPAPAAGVGKPPAGQQKAKSGEPAGQQAGEPLDSAQGPRSGPAGQQGGQPETGQPDAGQKPGEQKPEPGVSQEPGGRQEGPTQPTPASAAEQPAQQAASAGEKDRAKTDGAGDQTADKKAPAGGKPTAGPTPTGEPARHAEQGEAGGAPTTLPAVLPAAGDRGKAGKPDSGKFLDKAKDKLGGENDWARALKAQKTKLAQSRRGRAAAKGLRLAARAGAPSGIFFALLFPAVILDFWGLFSGLKDLTDSGLDLKDLTDSGLDVNWMDIFEGMFYTFLLIIYMVLRVFMPRIQVMFRPIRLLMPAAELIPFVDLLPFWTMTVLLAWNDARAPRRGSGPAGEGGADGPAPGGEEEEEGPSAGSGSAGESE